MPETLEIVAPHPTADRPLLGLTVLTVEDSRFASEAIRLLCLRSGARIRRASSLAAAHRHLSLYRPQVVIVDLGLPDGSGAALIRELAGAEPPAPVVIGTSGGDGADAAALAAGADCFLAKPVESLAVFQQTILAQLPADGRPRGPRPVPSEVVAPDPVAYADDLVHAAEILREADRAGLDYVAQFLGTVARSAHDDALESAARRLALASATGSGLQRDVARVAGLVEARLAEARTF